MWVQSESTMAAMQSGWINSTRMRILNLLGKNDYKSAIKALKLHILLCASVTGIASLLLFIFSSEISQVVSNEPDVQEWFKSLVWVLLATAATLMIRGIVLTSLS